MKQIENFTTALTQIYLEKSCQVLPNALWKSLADLEKVDCSFKQEEGKIVFLEIVSPDRLLLYWERERGGARIPPEKFALKSLALVHADYLDSIPASNFSESTSFFRLKHEGFSGEQIDPRWIIRDVEVPLELDQVADFLNRCYPGMRMSTDMVLSWTRHPVYDPHLWIWAQTKDRRAAGLGIGEFDGSIREGSLEWIQVLPGFRQQGVGMTLVNELLQRLAGRAEFTTVAGRQADGPAAERLYRRCGFSGDDVWWVLRNP